MKNQVSMDIPVFAPHMPVVEGYPRPDWSAIEHLLSQVPGDALQDAWCASARAWMELTARHVGASYVVSETPNFLLLGHLDERHTKLLKSFVERTRGEILRRLSGIAVDEGFGKSVVMLFDTQDAYYQYVSYFHGDGEFPLSAGMFLDREYGHIAIPFHDLNETEATLAHELTHSYLRHLPVPLWLNEGLAVTMEHELCGTHPLRMDPDRLAEHRAFWNEETVQEFWNGRSFGRTDEGIGLSYELARYCIRALAHDLEAFTRFANQATWEDGGEAAAHAVYGGSLGGLIEQFFGEGEWIPAPPRWRDLHETPEP
jgi:hypothetical protein